MKKNFISLHVVFFLIAFSSMAQRYNVIKSEPYNLDKLHVNVEPFGIDLWTQNINFSFGMRGNYFITDKLSLFLYIRKSYAETTKSTKKSLFSEAVISYDLFNSHSLQDIGVITDYKANQKEYDRTGGKTIVTTATVTTANTLGKVRKTVSLNAGTGYIRSGFSADPLLFGKEDTSLRVISSRSEEVLNDNLLRFQIVYAGLSFKKIFDVIIEDTYSDNKKLGEGYIRNFGFDYMLPLWHFYGNKYSKLNKFINYGWRVYWEFMPSRKKPKKGWIRPTFFDRLPMSFRFEIGSRPGVKSQRGYFLIGWGFLII